MVTQKTWKVIILTWDIVKLVYFEGRYYFIENTFGSLKLRLDYLQPGKIACDPKEELKYYSLNKYLFDT